MEHKVKRKYYVPEKRYGVIFDRWGQRKDGKPIRDIEIVEFTDSYEEIEGIEEIFVEFCKNVHKPKKDYKNETPSVMYGYCGYIVVDYEKKAIIKRYKHEIGFGSGKYKDLLIQFWLFASEEEREMADNMPWPEFLGWLRFKYGDGHNAIDYDGKPEGTEEIYEEEKHYF